MQEASLVSIVFGRFVEHPGIIIWILMAVSFQRYLFYRTYIPYGLTVFIGGGLATLLLRIISVAWFQSFLGFFTDLTHR